MSEKSISLADQPEGTCVLRGACFRILANPETSQVSQLEKFTTRSPALSWEKGGFPEAFPELDFHRAQATENRRKEFKWRGLREWKKKWHRGWRKFVVLNAPWMSSVCFLGLGSGTSTIRAHKWLTLNSKSNLTLDIYFLKADQNLKSCRNPNPTIYDDSVDESCVCTDNTVKSFHNGSAWLCNRPEGDVVLLSLAHKNTIKMAEMKKPSEGMRALWLTRGLLSGLVERPEEAPLIDRDLWHKHVTTQRNRGNLENQPMICHMFQET